MISFYYSCALVMNCDRPEMWLECDDFESIFIQLSFDGISHLDAHCAEVNMLSSRVHSSVGYNFGWIYFCIVHFHLYDFMQWNSIFTASPLSDWAKVKWAWNGTSIEHWLWKCIAHVQWKQRSKSFEYSLNWIIYLTMIFRCYIFFLCFIPFRSLKFYSLDLFSHKCVLPFMPTK